MKVTVYTQEQLIIPEGVYEAVVTDFAEHEQVNRFVNGIEQGVRIGFTIMEGPRKGMKALQFFTPKISPKSKLTLLCQACRGRGFTSIELQTINTIDDIKPMVMRMPVTLVITNRTSGAGKKYYSISMFLKSERIYPPELLEQMVPTAILESPTPKFVPRASVPYFVPDPNIKNDLGGGGKRPVNPLTGRMEDLLPIPPPGATFIMPEQPPTPPVIPPEKDPTDTWDNPPPQTPPNAPVNDFVNDTVEAQPR